jgi:GTP:adenosylcobinamide-phosphate guanylyltransferase
MDAIVIAGGIPAPDEPLYAFTQGRLKALLDVAGKPMVQWVLDALSEASTIERVVVIGLSEADGLQGDERFIFGPNQGGMLQNVRAGVEKVLELNPAARHVLTVSSDIPALKAEMVDWMVNTAMETDHDIYYSVITREVMERRFPASKRSYTRLKDVEICGGDMNMIRAQTVTTNDALWERLLAARKNALKQAALLGYDNLILLLTRRITMQDAVDRVTRRMDITGRVIFSPYAEIGMDIDKPHQLEILRADLVASLAA